MILYADILAGCAPRKGRCLCRPDEILGPYAGGSDTTTEDGRASDEDAPRMRQMMRWSEQSRVMHNNSCVMLVPSCPKDTESYAETNSRRRPQVWT